MYIYIRINIDVYFKPIIKRLKKNYRKLQSHGNNSHRCIRKLNSFFMKQNSWNFPFHFTISLIYENIFLQNYFNLPTERKTKVIQISEIWKKNGSTSVSTVRFAFHKLFERRTLDGKFFEWHLWKQLEILLSFEFGKDIGFQYFKIKSILID